MASILCFRPRAVTALSAILTPALWLALAGCGSDSDGAGVGNPLPRFSNEPSDAVPAGGEDASPTTGLPTGEEATPPSGEVIDESPGDLELDAPSDPPVAGGGSDAPVDGEVTPETPTEGVPPVDGEVDPVNPPPVEEPAPPVAPDNPFGTRNLFTEVLGIPVAEVEDKVQLAVNRFFGIGTGEPNQPIVNGGYRDYYELPQNPNQAFIWAADSQPQPDVRSEGMSYGMMIAVQMDMQQQFDRLWSFARDFMQFRPGTNRDTSAPWRNYFRWRVSPNTSNANNWQINNVQAGDGPAPDGEEYFAAALYLADRRWGSGNGINYEQEADAITAAMLNNAGNGQQTPLFNAGANQVVFYPQGPLAQFSDPSYHLPAFYEQIFATDGPQQDRNRWLQIAETSRQFFVTSANGQTGLHPDYARFNGAPEQGGNDNDPHNEFRYDAWRVVMNMAVDVAWSGTDPRLVTQVEKYHEFFSDFLGQNNVTEALFSLEGVGRGGGSSTALTATLAAGGLASNHPLLERYVENLWNVPQQQGQYRYYQECVYLLGLLAASGHYNYDWQ